MERKIYGTCALVFVGLLILMLCGAYISKLSSPPNISSSSEPLLSEIIERERAKWGLPKGAIETVIWIESRFNEHALNPELESSCAKNGGKDCESVGLMGIRPKFHGKPKNWIENIEKGARKLGQEYKKHGNDLRMAFARFNGKGWKAKRYAERAMRDYKIWSRRA